MAGPAGRGTATRPLGKGALAVLVAVPLVLGIMAGSILALADHSTVSAPTARTEYLYLTTAFDPATGLDKYFPANFTVPAGVPVVITITNYDNGTNPVPSAYTQVRGTVGGTETVTNASGTFTVATVPSDDATHTWTLDTGGYNVNAIVPPAASPERPTSVTFTVIFDSTGTFEWHCMAPCDPSAMGAPGFMAGFVTVVSG